MSWQSGPSGGEEPELPEPIEPRRNVAPERDDEQSGEFDFWGGASHFHRSIEGNQRSYPRSRRDR